MSIKADTIPRNESPPEGVQTYRGLGQPLDELIARLSLDDLKLILSEDIAAMIDAMPGVEDRAGAKRRIVSRFIETRPQELFSQVKVRETLYKSMTASKLQELSDRVRISSVEKLKTFNPLSDKEVWTKYLGFWGIDIRTAGNVNEVLDSEPVPVNFGLFPHQRAAANKVYNFIGAGRGRIILHMPTGAGKTRTAMHLVARFLNASEPTVVVWLASSAELLDQAADAFQAAWANLGNREVSLVRMWGDHNPDDLMTIKDGLIVAGLQKLHAYKNKNAIPFMRFSNGVKLVVVDEAHQAVAPTYRSLIESMADTGKFNAILGLTATPGRTWSNINEDTKLSSFFDENKVMLEVDGWSNPVTYLMDQGYLARPTFHKLSSDNAEIAVTESVDDYSDDTLRQLAEDVNRNILILNEVKRLLSAGHKRIIVFSSSVRHAEVLSAALNAIDIDSVCVTGETDKAIRSKIIKRFKAPSPQSIVLCNFGVLTTGFDAPNTSAAIIARPTKSLVMYSQMVGRATRGTKAGGNATCEISTVVDINLPGFGDMAEAFTNWEDVWNEPSK